MVCSTVVKTWFLFWATDSTCYYLPAAGKREREVQENAYLVLFGDCLGAWSLYVTSRRSHNYLMAELIGSEVCVTPKP